MELNEKPELTEKNVLSLFKHSLAKEKNHITRVDLIHTDSLNRERAYDNAP